MVRLFLLCSLVLTATITMAGTVRLCVSDQALIGITDPTHETAYQQEIRRLVETRGDTLEYAIRPWKRCLDEFQHGLHDGLAIAGFNSVTEKHGVFPLLPSGDIDTSLAVAVGEYVVVRRKNTQIEWDGQKFAHLNTPILVRGGTINVVDRLDQMHLPYYQQIQTNEQALKMLKSERADAAILHKDAAQALLTQTDYAGAIEMQEKPFIRSYGYLVFSKDFVRKRPAYVIAVWKALASEREKRTRRQ